MKKEEILRKAEELIGKKAVLMYVLFMECYLNSPSNRRTGLETLGLASHIFTNENISVRFTGESYEGWYKTKHGVTQYVLKKNRTKEYDIWTSDYSLKPYAKDIVNEINNLSKEHKRIVNAYTWIHDNFLDVVRIYAKNKEIAGVSKFKHKNMQEYIKEKFNSPKAKDEYEIVALAEAEKLTIFIKDKGSKSYIFNGKTKEEVYNIAEEKFKSVEQRILITYDKVPC